MDMFDFSQILEFVKFEPGHGLLQSALLFMIWLQSRGLRKELVELRVMLGDVKSHVEKRFELVERRITILEDIKEGIK